MTSIILINEPSTFYSYRDEDSFFQWLQSIEAVTNVVGVSNGLEVTLQDIDKSSLYDLIAIMTRYGLDMKCLAQICITVDEVYFKEANKYWYKAIFGS